MHKSARRYLPRARTDLTFRARDGHFALCDRAGSPTHLLSLAAALVWTHCDGRHDRDAIVRAVAGRIPEAADPVALDRFVTHLLERFADDGIVA